MGKVVYTKDEYMVIKDKRGHVLINMNGEYKNHGHLKKAKTAKMVIKLMKKRQVPRSDYLRETVLRVSLDEKYKAKVRNKIKRDKNRTYYININKGVVRK